DMDEAGYRATLATLNATEYVPLIVGGAGAALMTASLPWLLPDPPAGQKVPLWSIIVGSAGGAAALVGTYFLWRGTACSPHFDHEEGRCLDRAATTHLGPLMMATSLPMIAAPFTYLLNLRPTAEARDTSNVLLTPARDGRGLSLVWR